MHVKDNYSSKYKKNSFREKKYTKFKKKTKWSINQPFTSDVYVHI